MVRLNKDAFAQCGQSIAANSALESFTKWSAWFTIFSFVQNAILMNQAIHFVNDASAKFFYTGLLQSLMEVRDNGPVTRVGRLHRPSFNVFRVHKIVSEKTVTLDLIWSKYQLDFMIAKSGLSLKVSTGGLPNLKEVIIRLPQDSLSIYTIFTSSFRVFFSYSEQFVLLMGKLQVFIDVGAKRNF